MRDLAWQSLEPNQFGTDEFIQLCRKMGWTPMLTVNLGTGTPEEARNWVEYCNCPAGTKYARPARCQRRTSTATASNSGAWATRWTAPGSSAMCRPTNTPSAPNRRRR